MYKESDLYITSNDFASFANVIYSDRRSFDNNLFDNETEVIEFSNNPQFKHMTYKKLKFTIKSNDVIFCNTNQLDNLFFHLRRISKINDLTLITHQTDQLITQRIYKRKPKCIKKWFSVNVGFEENDLIPIPIGIASEFSKKNLIINDFSKFELSNFKKDEISLYLNFQKNTNYLERNKIYKIFEDKSWAKFDSPNLQKREYLEKISGSAFVLCPWGNGVDTHRVWESLYAGSIPVTKKHPTFKLFDSLPILFVDDYVDITYDLLSSYLNNLQLDNYNFDLLTKSYWRKLIENRNISSNNVKTIEEKFYISLYFKTKKKILNIVKTYLKKINSYLFRLINKLGL